MERDSIRRLCYVSPVWMVKRRGEFFAEPRFVHHYSTLVPLFPQAVLLGADASTSSVPTTHSRPVASLTSRLPNLEVRLLPMQGSRLARLFRHAVHLYRNIGESDLVCIDMLSETGLLAVLISRLRRKQFMVQFLGDWSRVVRLSDSCSLKVRAKTALAEWAMRSVVRCSPLALFQGKELYDRYLPLNPTGVQGDCVRTTLVSEAFCDRATEPFHEPVRLISVSSLVWVKGLETILRAMRLLAGGGRRVEWWCVGEGPSRQSLEDLAKSLGVGDRVRFFGFVPLGPELFQLYRQADIFVLPSLTEGLPMALLEAMANSLPVVASGVGGVPGVITNGTHGALVEPARPDQLAEAIVKLASDPGATARMREAAFNKSLEFRSDVVAERIKRLIENTFGRIGSAEEFVTR